MNVSLGFKVSSVLFQQATGLDDEAHKLFNEYCESDEVVDYDEIVETLYEQRSNRANQEFRDLCGDLPIQAFVASFGISSINESNLLVGVRCSFPRGTSTSTIWSEMRTIFDGLNRYRANQSQKVQDLFGCVQMNMTVE
jgi:hypothetical protein